MRGNTAADADEQDVQGFIDSIDPSTMRDAVFLRRIATARTSVEAAEDELVEAVRAARRAGDSWTAIGMALRTSKQNAHRKFAALVGEQMPGAAGDPSTNGQGSDVEGEVMPAGDGGWDIVITGSRSESAHFDTQAEAAARAREIIWGAGGGEISIHGRNGSVRARTRVSRRVS